MPYQRTFTVGTQKVRTLRGRESPDALIMYYNEKQKGGSTRRKEGSQNRGQSKSAKPLEIGFGEKMGRHPKK